MTGSVAVPDPGIVSRVTVDGRRFVDVAGREVILHGINVVCKDPTTGHMYPDMDTLLPRLAGLGFNFLRLGVFWASVEPAPGNYDNDYIGRVSAVIEQAGTLGLHVLIDLHQDLYGSAVGGEGAPPWATMHGNLPVLPGDTMWYQAYITSPALMRAADAFWADEPAADGVGIQTRYIAMLRHLANRLTPQQNVIGIEPMNEPYMGSIAGTAFRDATAAATAADPMFDLSKPDTISPAARSAMSDILNDRFKAFDRDTLTPFFERASDAIAASGPALFTGGNIYSSSFIDTAIGRLPEGAQAYAPHVYDAVTDAASYEGYDPGNLEALAHQKHGTQDLLRLPTVVGEWGAFPSEPSTPERLRHMFGLIEEYRWGSAYWCYQPGILDDPEFTPLVRGYPLTIGGTLRSYHWDYDAHTLTVDWHAEHDSSTVLYVPSLGAVTHLQVAGVPADTVAIDADSFGSGALITVTPHADGPQQISVQAPSRS